MNLDFFNYTSIDLENTVVRNPRVGTKNRPTSRTIDIGCTGIGSDGYIYTGERDVNTDYLIQGAVRGSIIEGSGTYTINDRKITNVTGLNGLQPADSLIFGDIIRADGSEVFYNVTGMSKDLSTIYLQDPNTSETGTCTFQARKIKLNSTYFEYISSPSGANKFYYDKNNNDWRYTGIQPSGPLVATPVKKQYILGDPLEFTFLKSTTKTAPDITSVDTTAIDPKESYGQKILSSKLVVDTEELALIPIPYPDDDQNFQVFYGPPNNLAKKTKDIDYTVNYQMDPDYTSAKPPYKDRTVAYLKFLSELDNVTQINSIDQNFQGLFNIHETPITPTAIGKAVTNIYPNAILYDGNTEYKGLEVKVGEEIKNRFFDYNVEYDNGIVNFIKHQNLETVVQNIIYSKNLLWDGISVVKGTTGIQSSDKSNLVLPYGIAGLTGINSPIFFEDIDQNDLINGTDYTIEYTSGAIKLAKPLKPSECVLVSYFVEGEDVVDEKLNLSTLRTSEYPVIESSVTITKSYMTTAGASTGSGIKILVEGVDFTLSYLTGKVTLLNQSVTENLQSLKVSYTPFAQINCILQPVIKDPKSYTMTIIDDILSTVDPFNLRFSIQNEVVSVPVKDPFGENPTTYSGSILPNSLLSVKGFGEPGYGLNNLTVNQMIDLGMTGLESLGLDTKLGLTVDAFYAIGITGIIELGLTPGKSLDYNTTNYTYKDDTKILALDNKYNINIPRPDLNDLILATYSFVSDVLPYAPIQTIFPIFNQDESSFIIEGYDKTDIIVPGMIFRIDNFDPEDSYYFKVANVIYDGYNTTVYLTGSFPEDIRKPSFYLFDDIVQWHSFPTGTKVDSNVSVGSNTLSLTGNLLQISQLIKNNSLIQLDNLNIYRAISKAVVNDTIQIGIFPNLLEGQYSDIKITDSIYQVGDTSLISEYPVIIDPPHPAFSLRYVAPTNAIYGTATIFIDAEKITLSEVVDDVTATYIFYFQNYGSIRDMVDAIVTTKSTIDPKYIYNIGPFTLLSKEGAEQYYIGSGFWGTEIIQPFTGSVPVVIPDEGYLFTISQEMYKYILINTTQGAQNFLVKKKDVTSYFSSGELLSFISKATGSLSFYEIGSVTLITADTQINFADSFTENMIDPYIYKYDSVNWIDTDSVGFSVSDNTITFSVNSQYFRIGSLLKIDSKYVYQIQNIEVGGFSVTITVNKTINTLIRGVEKVLVSDMPIYLSGVSPQDYFNIDYTLPAGRSGGATIYIDDRYITVTETLDGSTSVTKQIDMFRYGNLVQIASALSRLSLTVSGSIFVGLTDDQEDKYLALGNKAALAPTVVPVPLSTSIKIDISAFRINYTSPDSTVASEILLPPGVDYLVINEWKKSDKTNTLVAHTVIFSGKTLDQITTEISSLSSIIIGQTPWSIDQKDYDTFYGSSSIVYYTIVQASDSIAKSFPYSIKVIVNPEFWYQVPILNRNLLKEGKDYSIEGTHAELVTPISISERYELSYLGLDDLAEDSGSSIACSCRYFNSIPKGYQINVYMDYLNVDQYYVQKLTERAFLEIVTVPQIKDLLQQAGESAGIGNDSGSDNPPAVYQGGLTDLYYALKDELIKKAIYLKLFAWYKQRLRNFAAEAQLILGLKYGHSTFVGVLPNGQFTLQDAYVENNNYTLTTLSDIAQINNGFSKFFPVGYNDPAPQPYPRFEDTYQSYNQVFCYNIQYLDTTGKFIRNEGRVLSIKPYWANIVDSTTTFSSLDFDMLPYTQDTSFIKDVNGNPLYTIPYDQEEKHFRVTDTNFKFLERIAVGDQVQLNSFKTFYDIDTVTQVDPTSLITSEGPVEEIMFGSGATGTFIGQPLFYGNISDPNDPNYSPVYGIYKQQDPTKRFYVTSAEAKAGLLGGVPVLRQSDQGYTGINPSGPNAASNPIIGLGYTPENITTYEKLILKNGEYFTEPNIQTFAMHQSGDTKVAGTDYGWIYEYTKKNIIGIPVSYTKTLFEFECELPKDGQNINVKRVSSNDFPISFPAYDDEYNLGVKAIGSKLMDQKTGSDTIVKTFDLSDFLGINVGDDKTFTVYEGTYNDLTGLWQARDTINIVTTPLNYFDERSVTRILETIKYGVDGYSLPVPFPPFIIKISNIRDKKAQSGADKLFYISFDKKYEANESSLGYYESIVFRARDRNSWVTFNTADDASNITRDYGFSDPSIFTNFYYPNNLYLKLLIEKQNWLVELNIVKDLFDTSDKLKRAFNLSGVSATTSGPSEFLSYLLQISEDSTVSNINTSINSYAEHLRFLLDSSDTSHKYLIYNTSGPLYRTMMEIGGTTDTDPIHKSYTQAAAAFSNYTNFQGESNLYSSLNNFYYSMWQTQFIKWVLSLEAGSVFQKQAKQAYDLSSAFDVGIETYPAIKLSVIDQTTVSDAKYLVTYNLLATSNSESDEYDDATLLISYQISGSISPIVKSFVLSVYPTLQDLVNAINTQCVNYILAASVFDYFPYRDYSPRYILRNYRSLNNNDSNGPDISISTGGWTILSKDPSIDDRLYVSNVSDHRNYDSRVLFLSRKSISSDTIVSTSSGEVDIAFPNYAESTGKEILGPNKMGPLPVTGKWAEDIIDPINGDTVDYTTELNVLEVTPLSPDDMVIDYEFLGVSSGQDSSVQDTLMYPNYETSPEDLEALGYSYQTKMISEVEPDISEFNQYVSTSDKAADKDNKANFNALLKIVNSVSSTPPPTEILRYLRIRLRVDVSNIGNFRDISFIFTLRQYSTIDELKYALENNRYTIPVNSNTAVLSSTGAQYFTVNYPTGATKTLQGSMKTIDLFSQYVKQTIEVDSHLYYEPEGVYDILSSPVTIQQFIPVTETISSTTGNNFQVGWMLQGQDIIGDRLIKFRIDPKTYSPGTTYRFIPNNPKNSREANLFSQNIKQDILAFDIYSWDNSAAYKIQDNILYLKSASIPETGDLSVSIPLYKTENLDITIDHPEETYKLIDVIRLINNNGLCNQWFFANLRFGREYNSDYEYTYFPNTVQWVGGDGWVSIEKAQLDSLYLDVDNVFTIQSEGNNASYYVTSTDPLPPILDPSVVYKSSLLTIQADTRAFMIVPNTVDYDIVSSSYTVNTVLETMILNALYQTFVSGTATYDTTTFTINTLITAINGGGIFSASLALGMNGALSATTLVESINMSLPGTIYANDGITIRAAIILTMASSSYTGTQYSKPANILSLGYIQTINSNVSHTVDLSVNTTINEVITDINGYDPILGEPLFNANLTWISGSDDSSLLINGTINISIGGTFVRMLGSYSYDLSDQYLISDVVSAINSTTSMTGFSAIGLDTPEYLGYNSLLANLLIPTVSPISFTGTSLLRFDFRSTVGLNVLNMSHTVNINNGVIDPSGEASTCIIDQSGIFSCTKNTKHKNDLFIGNTYTQNIVDKNINKFRMNAMNIDGYLEQLPMYPNFSYAYGILNMDIALLSAGSVSFGKLQAVSKNLGVNDPESAGLNTHVYFGFLGDIRFYQISDYSLWKQYILIRRRLGMPWYKDNNGNFLPDYYVPNSDYSFGNFEYSLNLVENGKFLYYLKYQRFSEIINSLNSEDLYNNKYMWLFLKFHREIGCDQKSIAIQNRINQDKTKALELS
jgi:hypothetical protein